MTSSHVCLACRRTLSRNRLHKVIQWRPRATFISLSEKPTTTTDDKPKQDLLNLGDLADEEKKRHVRLGSPQERRKRSRQPSPYNDGDLLEALFEESLKDPSPGVAESPTPTSSVGLYILADTLRTMLADENVSVGDAWKFYVQHFGPEAWRNGTINQKTQPRNLHLSRNLLTRKLLEAKRKHPFSQDLPTITEFSKVHRQLGESGSGELRAGNWCDAMIILLENLIKLDQFPPEDFLRKERIITDIIGSWNVVFRRAGKAQEYSTEGSPLDWSHIPTISIRESSIAFQRTGMQSVFGQFAPIFPLRTLSGLAVVAVASFALLTKESMADEAVEASPLISSLATAIAVNSFDIGSLAGTKAVPPSVEQFIQEMATKTKEVAITMQIKLSADEAISNPPSETKLRSTINRSLSPSIRTDIATISKRLCDAQQRQDRPQIDKLWSDVKGYPVSHERPTTSTDALPDPSITSNAGRLTADLCNYFITIYMAVRAPTGAVEVWNHMVRSGLPPSLKTWNAMMDGCKWCRDHKALEDVWMRMQQLGVQPDVHCWTTRISGLIECNKLEKGMQALDEMGRLWVASTKRELPGAPKQKNGSAKKVTPVEPVRLAVKPTIATVNAALSGLLRRHQTEAAHRVLAWAVGFDVKPDVITYNTLLVPLIRDGHSTQAMALLTQMQKEGIEADVATFTTILDETFRHSSELSHEEQTAVCNNILSGMEAAGVTANIHAYSKMIHQLLQNANGDLRAVNAVMKQMAARDVKPTTYIYTMLMTYYFEREPADLDAVRTLIENAKMEVGNVNHIFWDRAIEGYARNGETATAMRILGEVQSRASKVSWVAKQVLLSSLVQNDQRAIAKNFVRDVKNDPRPAPEMKGQQGQQRFWRLAAELELL